MHMGLREGGGFDFDRRYGAFHSGGEIIGGASDQGDGLFEAPGLAGGLALAILAVAAAIAAATARAAATTASLFAIALGVEAFGLRLVAVAIGDCSLGKSAGNVASDFSHHGHAGIGGLRRVARQEAAFAIIATTPAPTTPTAAARFGLLAGLAGHFALGVRIAIALGAVVSLLGLLLLDLLHLFLEILGGDGIDAHQIRTAQFGGRGGEVAALERVVDRARQGLVASHHDRDAEAGLDVMQVAALLV